MPPETPEHDTADGEAGTKPGPANPRTDAGADAATPPGGPLRQDAAGAPEDHQAGTHPGGDVVGDDHPDGGEHAQDSADPNERPDVASAPPTGSETRVSDEDAPEATEHQPSSAAASE